MNWYLGVLKKYAVFEGRARRAEYWYFFLFNFIIAVILNILDRTFGTISPVTGAGILGTIYGLAILLPGLAVAARRLHDTDRSGWWLLLLFIPFIGAIVILIFMIIDGTPGENRFGADPKRMEA